MEVTLKAGDSLQIPEGCKAVIMDNVVVFEKEEKAEVQEFKDGDVLCGIYDDDDTILIFKEVSKIGRDYFDSHYNNDGVDDKVWCSKSFRYATEEEKQQLFDKMKEQGLKWNAEEKRVEKIRWRAKCFEFYYWIDVNLAIRNINDTYSSFDNEIWDAFNYFRTKEQAKEAAKRVKETLRKYHEEIGE